MGYETGRMVRYYRVTCANCGLVLDLGQQTNVEGAIRDAKREGWSQHYGKQHLWHCSVCIQGVEQAESQAKLQEVLRARTN